MGARMIPMTHRRRFGVCVAVAVALMVAAAGATGSSAAVSSRATGGAVLPVTPKPSIGCRRLTAFAPGQRKLKLKPGYYARYIPHSFTGATAFPLVIDLHGYLEEAQFHASNSMLGAYGDTHGFVTVTPEGAASDGTSRTLAQTSGGKSVARGGPIPVIVAAWATRNGCGPTPTETIVASDVRLV